MVPGANNPRTNQPPDRTLAFVNVLDQWELVHKPYDVGLENFHELTVEIYVVTGNRLVLYIVENIAASARYKSTMLD